MLLVLKFYGFMQEIVLKMNSLVAVIFITITIVSALYEFPNVRRQRRDAVGSLDIITNHAQPIHADVRNDQRTSEKPCPKSLADYPAKIEAGVVFKVTPPKNSFSLRRTFPLTNTLDLARGISRLITVVVLAVSAIIELYPILQGAYETVHELVYLNKF